MDTDRQLLQRNRELSATVLISQATSSGRLNLAETLERALQAVLEITGLSAGWVMLLPEAGDDELVFIKSVGLPPDTAKKQADFRSSECECAKILALRKPFVVHPLHTGCPVGSLRLENGQLPSCHVTVPLLSRSKVLGVLNLLGQDMVELDTQELGVLGAIGRQLGIAVENARLWEELKRREDLHSQMLKLAITSQEDERKRIARELHDQVGQALTSILVWLRALEPEGDGMDELTIRPQEIRELKGIVSGTMNKVRELAIDLRPSVLDDLGLVPALQRYAATCNDRYGLNIEIVIVGLEGERLDQVTETALYRITQEALSNVIQHASAKQASLLLTKRAQTVVLVVEDDGCGFDADRLLQEEMVNNWLGLSGMCERAELVGGRFTIESAAGKGTAVYVEIPLNY